jgi:hypothetical protein
MDLRTTGMEFASEMVIKATLMKLRTSEVPTTLSPDGRSRPPHLRPWRDGWRHLRFMLLYSPHWLFLYPGLLLTIFSTAFAALIMTRPVTIGGVHFEVDSLIYLAFFVVIGIQAVLFSFLSRVYAKQEKLYPAGEHFNSFLDHITLERGLAAGIVVSACGLYLGIYTVLDWQRHSFGEMNFSSLARLVVPSATGMTVGLEIILFSLFLSTLQLSVRHITLSTNTEFPARTARPSEYLQSQARSR